MKLKSLLPVLIAASAFGAFTSVSNATVLAVANVLSSTATTTTVQFTFSGDLSGVTTPANLQNYLFFGLNSGLVSATTNSSVDITSFLGNSVQMTPSSSLSLIEVRVNGAPFYDRMGFKFTSNLSTSSSFASGSSVTVTLPIGSATSSSFAGLPVYWGMPANYSDDNNARGTLVGSVAAVPEPSLGLVASLAFVHFFRRKRYV